MARKCIENNLALSWVFPGKSKKCPDPVCILSLSYHTDALHNGRNEAEAKAQQIRTRKQPTVSFDLNCVLLCCGMFDLFCCCCCCCLLVFGIPRRGSRKKHNPNLRTTNPLQLCRTYKTCVHIHTRERERERHTYKN